MSAAAAASLLALNTRGGGVGQRAPTVPTGRVPFNGAVSKSAEGSSTSTAASTLQPQPQQQPPVILHRRVRKPSSVLRLNQPMWGTENPPTNFASTSSNANAFYTSSAVGPVLPPPSAAMVHHLSSGATVSEVQVPI